MVGEQQIHDEVEKTIASLDDDGILPINPFLITKIQAERESRVHKHRLRFALRMNLGYIAILVILLVNLITLIDQARDSNDTLQQQLISD